MRRCLVWRVRNLRAQLRTGTPVSFSKQAQAWCCTGHTRALQVSVPGLAGIGQPLMMCSCRP